MIAKGEEEKNIQMRKMEEEKVEEVEEENDGVVRWILYRHHQFRECKP